jgi:hypothetical protein
MTDDMMRTSQQYVTQMPLFDTPDLTQDDASITQKEVHIGPITQSRAKKLQEVNSLLDEINFFMY